MKIENKNIEIEFISKDYKKFNVDFLSDVFKKINKERKDILNVLEINDCRKIKIFLFDDRNTFLDTINRFYIKYKVPEYCKGTIQEGKIYFLVNNNVIRNTFRYETEMRKVLHEYIHILYNEYIIDNKDRVTWLDEGIALNLSKEKGKFFKERFPILKENIIKIDLNSLEHEKGTFVTKEINGYDVSYLAVKYLLEKKSREEFNEIIRNNKKVREMRKKNLVRSNGIF